MTTALYSGSFDPVHLGHLGLIRTAASMFDQLVVVVLDNPAKRSGLASVDTRVELLRRSTEDLPNVSCHAHAGLTVDAARRHGATVIVRSLHKELDNELTMAATNQAIAGVATGFVRADESTQWISSTIVRALLAQGRLDDACALVPDAVADWLRSAPPSLAS